MFSTRFSTMPKAAKFLVAMVGGLILVAVIGLALGFVVQFLWNRTIAAMFALPAISYWQAFGLFMLAKLFFGMGTGGGGSSHKRKKRHGRCSDVKSTDGSELVDDVKFKEYWQEEGKEAYEAYLATHSEDRTRDSDEG